MKSFAQIDRENNGDYVKLLTSVASLSGLFSDSETPLINYRSAENIFCRSFNAKNLSRSDTAFDAKYKSIGVGLKTFTVRNDKSTEKVAEFNSVSSELSKLKGMELAVRIAYYRNKRIELAINKDKIESSIYHIVARKKNQIILFETDYGKIDIQNIKSVNSNDTSISFSDGKNQYRYNYSKSTLFRLFRIPKNAIKFDVSIIKNPFELLLQLSKNKFLNHEVKTKFKDKNYIILPLYSFKNNKKYVPPKSGLNLWNAGGRERKPGEMYIPVQTKIRKRYNDFFPDRNKKFKLHIPGGKVFSAKICQDGGKALMTNPNTELSDWLLRDILQLKEGELATIEKLDQLGFDSVLVIKNNLDEYELDIMKTGSYENFISE